MARELKILISGGGTGGHIFPAVAIANYLRDNYAPCHIQFVGATGKMEMEKIPLAGYNIIGLPVSGLKRKVSLSNLILPYKILSSLLKAINIVNTFKPDVAVGVGGYASGPAMMAALLKGVPVVLQEQNGFAGITNKWLGKYAKKVCVAYNGMEKFFNQDKIVLTGNPVRRDIIANTTDRSKALASFKFNAEMPVLLVLGGSLGAGTINKSIAEALPKFKQEGINVIWQCGKNYYDNLKSTAAQYSNVVLYPFISDMSIAYQAADIVVSRAGALSISELCIVGKPAILVPSPNVAEDHQRHNAISLVKANAALMVLDTEANAKLAGTIITLLNDNILKSELSANIRILAKPDADKDIVNQIMSVVKS